jgi:hypothetical protein
MARRRHHRLPPRIMHGKHKGRFRKSKHKHSR